MDALLRTLLSAQRGVCSTRDADRVGATPVYLHRLVRDGELVRVRRGAFVDAMRLGEATSEQRFELGARAILRSRPGDIASHHTALALMGLPLWGVDLARFDVCTAVTHVSVSGGLVKHPWLGGAMVRWPNGVTTLDVAHAVTTTAAASRSTSSPPPSRTLPEQWLEHVAERFCVWSILSPSRLVRLAPGSSCREPACGSKARRPSVA